MFLLVAVGSKARQLLLYSYRPVKKTEKNLVIDEKVEESTD
jgi:hypothetical protein